MKKNLIDTEYKAEKAAEDVVKKQVELSKKTRKGKSEKCVIDLNVKNDDDFLSPFSNIGKPVISEDVALFLENSANAYHPKSEIELNVYGDCISEEEHDDYENAIRNYYSLKFSDAARCVTRKGFISLIFTIIGIVGLALMVIMSELGAGSIWVECVDIFAWVFIWEAVDQFFIERNGVLLNMNRYYSFTRAKISFKNNK